MWDEHYIKKRTELAQYLNSPIVLGTYKEEAPRVGADFSEEIRQYIEHAPPYRIENLYQRGLTVYSTLVFRVQRAAETSIQRGLRTFDHRRGFRKPARNLISEGIDPLA